MPRSAKTFAHLESEIERFDQLLSVIDVQLLFRDIDPCQHILPAQVGINVKLIVRVEGDPSTLADEPDESDGTAIQFQASLPPVKIGGQSPGCECSAIFRGDRP